VFILLNFQFIPQYDSEFHKIYLKKEGKNSFMQKVGIVYDNIYAQHDTERTTSHPECKERVLHTLEVLKEQGMWGSDIDGRYVNIAPEMAEPDQIRWAHSDSLINSVRATVEKAENGMPYTYMDGDTPVSAQSYNAALSAVGGNFSAIDKIFSGEIQKAFVLCRPPGHHANRGNSRGFCLFNNIILSVHYLFKQKNLQRVAIYDFDVHAGNGSEDLIWNGLPDSNGKELLFISSHQNPAYFYPFECFVDDIGEGAQKGKIVNIPFRRGAGDESVQLVMNEIIKPLMEEFKPEFILISAGFDAHFSDPIGGLGFTRQTYWKIIEELKPIAEKYSNGRMQATLEGGYNIDALGDSITNVIRSMAGDKPIAEDDYSEDKKALLNTETELIPTIKDIFSEYWNCFK